MKDLVGKILADNELDKNVNIPKGKYKILIQVEIDELTNIDNTTMKNYVRDIATYIGYGDIGFKCHIVELPTDKEEVK